MRVGGFDAEENRWNRCGGRRLEGAWTWAFRSIGRDKATAASQGEDDVEGDGWAPGADGGDEAATGDRNGDRASSKNRSVSIETM